MLLSLSRLYYTIKNKLSDNNPQFISLNTCWQQLKTKSNKSWIEQEFLVADLEMTSLDHKTGHILSIGWVTVSQGMIKLCSAEHHVIRSKQSDGQRATIHQLRDCEIAEGLSITEISELFLKAAAGKVLVFHNANLDMAFLNKAAKSIYGAPLLLPIADTLLLEKKKLLRHNDHIAQGELRLAACRDRYNLPLYPAHNALMDALATAELFCAIAQHKGHNTKLYELSTL